MPDETIDVELGETTATEGAAATEGVKRDTEAGHAETPQASAGGKSPGRPRKPPATLPPADGDKPPVSPSPPDKGNGKRRVKCADLKGKKVIVGKGEAVQVDENGFLEVEEKAAKRLLSIPGYEEA
jgi:hypothetical protein